MQASPDSGLIASAGAPQFIRIVTFLVDDRQFGVEVGLVREIKGWQETTPLPNTAHYVLGVLNLRGTVITVFDFKARLGLGRCAMSRASVILVLDLGGQPVGLLVDAVSDIVDIPRTDLRPPPETHGVEEVLLGLAVRGERVIALPNLSSMIGFLPEAATSGSIQH